MTDESLINESEALAKAKQYFTQSFFPQSIYYYNLANAINPRNAITHSNLAICYLKMKDYSNSANESDLALKLNPKSVKALICKSKSLAFIGIKNYNLKAANDSLHSVQIALDLCRSSEFFGFYNKVAELFKQVKLMNFYTIEERKKKVVLSLKEYYSKALDKELFLALDKYLVVNISRELPEGLTCPITLDIFRVPIATPSGNTYESRYLLEYCSKMGFKDPISKKEFYQFQLIENKNVKLAAESFQKRFPWAAEGSAKTYQDIDFS